MTVYFLPAQSARADACWQEVKQAIAEVERSLSLTGEESCIAAYNSAPAGAWVELNETGYTVLSLALEWYDKTAGYYNPAVGLSVDLWGFSPRFSEYIYRPTQPYDRTHYRSELPQEDYITAFQALSDCSALRLEERDGRYYAVKPALSVTVEGRTYTQQLDLSGIGKGYAADLAYEIVCSYGFSEGYVACSDSSLWLSGGTRSDGLWELGVNNPQGAGHCAQILTAHTAVSSSGDYERYYTVAGTRYCHIIDPFTGRPIQSGVNLATALCDSAAAGDAITTALCVMGQERAMTFLQEQGLQGLVVCDSQIFSTVTDSIRAEDGFVLAGGSE